MTPRLGRLILRLASVLLLGLLLGFSLGAVSSARAASGRSAPVTTLQAILDALEALTSGLRPPSNGQTRLLFPVVSTLGTNSTTLFIANTGQDPSGTPGHSGDCTIELFGTVPTPPALGVAFSVSVGSLVVPVLHSGVVADFRGYAVATCAFPFAHEVYLLTTAAGSQLAPALMLPPTRAATVVEALGQ